MDSNDYKKIEIECANCKAKFDVWVSMADYTPEQEEIIKRHFYNYCPACKALEELEIKQQQK